MTKIVVSAFYKFFPFPDYFLQRTAAKELLNQYGVKGTLLLASEGVNGTVAGSREAIDALNAWFAAHPDIGVVATKESFTDSMPFSKMKVKLKKELISLGAPAHPMAAVGEYIDPQAWNELISNPETIVLDTRNDYEVEMGSFKGAINPHIKNFKQLAAYTREQLAAMKERPVATFCTGGIRCEKYTAYLVEQGFKHVYHLKGGILKYLEEIPEEKSLWEGSCFVFDDRIAVGHGLQASPID